MRERYTRYDFTRDVNKGLKIPKLPLSKEQVWLIKKDMPRIGKQEKK
jgi:hypothetical protein